MNQCGACGLDFGSVSAFDAHRTGTFVPLTRRCRSAAELTGLGWKSDSAGRWRTPAPPDYVEFRGS